MSAHGTANGKKKLSAGSDPSGRCSAQSVVKPYTNSYQRTTGSRTTRIANRGTLVWTSSCEHGQEGPHIVRWLWDEDGTTPVWCEGDTTGWCKGVLGEAIQKETDDE